MLPDNPIKNLKKLLPPMPFPFPPKIGLKPTDPKSGDVDDDDDEPGAKRGPRTNRRIHSREGGTIKEREEERMSYHVNIPTRSIEEQYPDLMLSTMSPLVYRSKITNPETWDEIKKELKNIDEEAYNEIAEEERKIFNLRSEEVEYTQDHVASANEYYLNIDETETPSVDYRDPYTQWKSSIMIGIYWLINDEGVMNIEENKPKILPAGFIREFKSEDAKRLNQKLDTEWEKIKLLYNGSVAGNTLLTKTDILHIKKILESYSNDWVVRLNKEYPNISKACSTSDYKKVMYNDRLMKSIVKEYTRYSRDEQR